MFKEGRAKHRSVIYPYFYEIFSMGGGMIGCVLVQDPFSSEDTLKARFAEIAQTTYDQYMKQLVDMNNVRWFGTYWYDSVQKARYGIIDGAEMRRRYLCQAPQGSRMLEEVSLKVVRKGLFGRESKLAKPVWGPYKGSPEWLEKVMTDLDEKIGDYRKLI